MAELSLSSCPECGSPVVFKKYEYFCSICGLVVRSSEEFMFQNSADTHNPPKKSQEKNAKLVSLKIKNKKLTCSQDQIFVDASIFFASKYTSQYPKAVRERAMTLAQIVAKKKITNSAEAIGLACAHAAVDEMINKTLITEHAVSRGIRKKASKVLDYLKKNNLYTPSSPYDKIKTQIHLICSKHGFPFDVCWKIFLTIQNSLSGKPHRLSADVSCFIYSIFANRNYEIKSKSRYYKVANISKKILEQYEHDLKKIVDFENKKLDVSSQFSNNYCSRYMLNSDFVGLSRRQA